MKTFRLILMLFILPVCALAQGAQYTGIAQTARNMIGMGNVYVPIPGASVNVCTGVYTGTACPSGGNVTVYSNQALTTSLTQPITADSYGNFTFWAAPGVYYFTVTGQGAASSSYQITLPFGISGTYNATAKSIENTRYSDQYTYPSASASNALIGSSFSTISPGWQTLPLGLTSGGFGRVSISGTAVTWVAGDKFNPNWSNKSATINSGSYTIASCTSTTSCTLSASYTGSTTFGPWMAVGHPTSVYISGGTGTAEAMTVLGIGASECPGGSALSVCGIPANTHSGTYSIQSATSGVQEAMNDLGGSPGRVYMPTGTATWYAPVYALSGGIDLSGYSKNATVITDLVSGNAPALLVEGNYNHVHSFRINGSGSTGNLIDYWDTSNSGASGQSTFDNLMLASSTGTGTSVSGTTMTATCFYTSGAVGNTVQANLLSGCGQGVQVDSNGGAGADGTIFAGNQFTNSTGDGVLVLNGASTTFTGNRFDFNGGLGLDIKGGSGYAVHGNYFEHDRGGSIQCNGSCYGLSISGNEMTQYDTDGAAFVSITPNPGSQTPSTGVSIAGNYMLLNGHGTTPTVTAFISGGFSHSSVAANTLDVASPAVAPSYGVNVIAGGNSGAGIDNAVAGNVSGPNGGPTDIVYDQASSPNLTIPNASNSTVSYNQSIIFNRGAQIVGGAGRESQLLLNTGGPAILAGYGLPAIGSTGFSLGSRVIVGNGTGVALCFSSYASSAYTDLGCVADHGTTFGWGTLNGSQQFPFTVDSSGNVTGVTINATALKQGGVNAALQGADINSSNQVTATHLSAPLPTAQGGTGQNSSAIFPASGTVAVTSQLPLSGSVSGSTTALAANSCGDTVTQAVTGATTTMTPVVTVSGALPTSGLVIQSAVTATNTVSIEYCNVTTAPITPAAATLEIRVVP